MRIGRLIASMALLMRIAWQLCLMLLQMRWTSGRRQQRRRAPRLLPFPSRVSPNACGQPVGNEAHWISSTVAVQQVQRKGMSDVYVGGANGKSIVFYDVNDLAMWLLDQGVMIDDPVWDYLEQLQTTELR